MTAWVSQTLRRGLTLPVVIFYSSSRSLLLQLDFVFVKLATVLSGDDGVPPLQKRKLTLAPSNEDERGPSSRFKTPWS